MVRPIETPRLILRDWRDHDVEAWFAMNSDPRVMEFFPGTYDRGRAESSALQIRAALQRDGYGWRVVEIKGGAPFAGVVALTDVPFEAHFTPAREIGWRFARDAWGRGYATEAAFAALHHAFEDLGWDEVVAMTAARNARSQRLMERLGMTRDPADDFEHPRLAPGDPLRPHVLYRIGKGGV